MSKKILMISQNFYPEIGSAGNRAKNIYLLLKQKGYDITVLSTEPSYPNKKIYDDLSFWDDELVNDEDVRRVKIKNRKYSQSVINRLIYYIEISLRMLIFIFKDKSTYDVIFVTSPPIFIGLVGFYAKQHYKSKLILDIRDLWPESLKGVGLFNYPPVIYLFRKIEKTMYKKANAITVNSKGFIDYITNDAKTPNEKITYIPNGARHSEISISVTKQQDKNVVYVGNLGLAQDVHIIMELSKLLNKYNISLDIIAYGMKQKEFVHFVKKHNLTNVHFISPKTRRDCLNLISNYQVGLVTLTTEDVFETVLPGKIIDYMTCGIPIVGAVSGYSKEVITRENVGFVSESQNPNEMLKHILRIIDSREIQNLFHKNAKNVVRSNFMWEKNIKVLIQVIESVTGEKYGEEVKYTDKAETG
ncbi:glycosyltransferase family 4 protein [Priestia aryabhattai]|uniref:glycosyltransferase family 4 protein n=1 Tax=Priestia aryabhattai TaxID=412384 RepID=UPI003D2C6019